MLICLNSNAYYYMSVLVKFIELILCTKGVKWFLFRSSVEFIVQMVKEQALVKGECVMRTEDKYCNKHTRSKTPIALGAHHIVSDKGHFYSRLIGLKNATIVHLLQIST